MVMNFFPDPRVIVGGKVVETGISEAQGVLDDLQGKTPPKSTEEILKDIHILFVELATWLMKQPAVQGDQYKFVTIYKAGFGPPYIPAHIGNRLHFALFSGTSYLLNATRAGAIGNFNVTTLASDWRIIDFPDGTEYNLDPSVTPNQVTFWQRETNQQLV